MKRTDFLKILFLTPVLLPHAKADPILSKNSLFELGAKGNGKDDDTKAFQEYFKHHDNLDLPDGYHFIIGDLILRGKTIRGPGKISLKKGSDFVFKLEGKGNRLENLQFVSAGKGKRPESEIILGESMQSAVITGCDFSGQVFTAISMGVNSELDKALKAMPIRKDLWVSECSFKGKYAHHVYLHLIENVNLSKNRFEESQLDSVRLRQFVKKVSIIDNFFNNIGVGDTKDSRDAIDCYWSGHEVIIRGNQMEKMGTHGIDLKGHSPDDNYGSGKVIISGNIIKSAGYSALFLSSGAKTLKGWKALKNVTISSNLLENNGLTTHEENYAALYMRHNQEMIIIEGNQIFNNRQKGILLGNFEPDAPVSKNIIIKGNLLNANGSTGIHIMGGKNILVSDNIIDQKAKGLVSESYRNFKLEDFKETNNIKKD